MASLPDMIVPPTGAAVFCSFVVISAGMIRPSGDDSSPQIARTASRHAARRRRGRSNHPCAGLAAQGGARRAKPRRRRLGLNALGPKALEDVAIATGAAIGALDAVVRRRRQMGGAWWQRLALAAAAVTARQAGRVEDERRAADPPWRFFVRRPRPPFCSLPGAGWQLGPRRIF
ncbi:DUF1403 family protein [Mesorhizobium sp. M0203]|uniref:DUF1403 family protein n=1 Tax=Mesorhizobium sp. M0203 TaxID=2956912 RepID=UPI00333BD826